VGFVGNYDKLLVNGDELWVNCRRG